jgi:TetR/AcrR family transcriptional repressor of nem operon
MRQVKPRRSDSKALHVEILKAAAPFIKLHGASAPVDQIMKAAGLTSGALYSHFKNKEDLCIQVMCSALDEKIDEYRVRLGERGRAGLEMLIDGYLSAPHVDAVADGCPFASLGADMAKASPRAKRLYQARVEATIDVIAGALDTGSPQQRHAKAQYMLAAMVGAVTLARAMADRDAIAALLSQVRASVRRELD